ncbi:hypothetical protein [Photobacterium leiognathi]|uniref:hypothetical protein n=1 Tax=Photobacterium leiognathi TaxID=553611 RepID=UPI002738BEF2|nr:hypothetical protein [Photobacterium leiognathi]
MDELAKAVQKKYIEDLMSKYPIHRFIILLIFMLSVYIYDVENNLRLVDGVDEIKVSFIFDFKNGLLASVTIQQLFVCLVLTYLTSWLYGCLSEYIFKLLSKSTNFDDYTKKITENVDKTKSNDNFINYYVSRDVSQELEKSRTYIKSTHASGEMLFSIVIALLLGGINIQSVDFLLISAVFCCVIFIQWRIFTYYISNFIPYYLTEKTLLGSTAKFGDM